METKIDMVGIAKSFTLGAPKMDLENLRTMEEYRRDIDFEIRSLRAAGLSDAMIDIWLAGARWATRICGAMQRDEVSK